MHRPTLCLAVLICACGSRSGLDDGWDAGGDVGEDAAVSDVPLLDGCAECDAGAGVDGALRCTPDGPEFECTTGQRRDCSLPPVDGCRASGQQQCVECRWQACIPEERCDRADNDCDGFIDEGGLVQGAPQRLGDWRSAIIEGAYNPLSNQVGVVLQEIFTGPEGAMQRAEFARIDARTGALIGTREVFFEGASGAFHDIIFDGEHWANIGRSSANRT